MHRILIVVLFFLLTNACRQKSSEIIDSTDADSYYNEKAVIDASSLNELIKSDPTIQIVDYRDSLEFHEGHISGAININQDDITDRKNPIDGIRADRSHIENALSKAGLDHTRRIYIYDDKAGCYAARLWWVLYSYGFTECTLLNGGLTSWLHEGYSIVKTNKQEDAGSFKFPENSVSSIINVNDVLSTVNKNDHTIVDARSEDEYSGKTRSLSSKRAGRIPGSIFMDWSFAVDYNGTKKFKSYPELLNAYEAKGITRDKNIITYCRSGVRSAHTTFVLQELLGYQNVSNYDGSWMEWSEYDDLPVIQDSVEIKTN